MALPTSKSRTKMVCAPLHYITEGSLILIQMIVNNRKSSHRYDFRLRDSVYFGCPFQPIALMMPVVVYVCKEF